jgi:acetylglutamate/LysW-gamma-L-alpha-aminoadipate kinase
LTGDDLMTGITLIKCGGNSAVNPLAICADVARMYHEGQQVILAHGGSADIDALAGRLGVVPRRLVSPDGVSARHTDATMLDVVTLALAGRVKPRLLQALARLGVPAIGLTGLDGQMLRGPRKQVHRAIVDGRRVLVRDDRSGKVTTVNAGLLGSLLAARLVPVISPPALAYDGTAVNADADRVAAAVAAVLHAQTLVMLTGAPGVLADVTDETSVLPVYRVPPAGAPGDVSGGMRLKLVAAREALSAGVPRVLIADGRTEHPVTAALAGRATQIRLATKGAEEMTVGSR